MQTEIVPCLWFNTNAKAAATFYCSVFNDSEICSENDMLLHFKINGKRFTALNGGPEFTINEATSFFVYCGCNAEIERIYTALVEGGTILMPLQEYPWCKKYAWVKDKFGVSWQLDIDPINAPQTIVPSLLFTEDKYDKLDEASTFYQSLFPKSMALLKMPYGNSTPNVKADTTRFTQFKLNTNIFNIMSSPIPHEFNLNEGVSFTMYCDSQEEINTLWEQLTSDGGQESQCGWVKDKYGVSWQIVPTVLESLLSDANRAPKVMEAFLKMKKLDIETLLKA
ncbi:3-demethylubiquinone-9 3-methyltransferase [Formosa agariphila KMM 3901]|uniref:3-demethylubiquinone-9 3-methyltransferase n=1 Tax=Formosa agariphila (strain DSM 15362 / KCTC 12365 / LMG 23005 / KMM 3901 / M-2Alg 35-1) TaxID=1347342 RepID=T2KHQ5_FORAG|nr:VOC family protein [Formosa agariphila]CDF78382.1 3-demethylubiquinone-9 3-methyltransferase [Formosa agariphila KMM 3901]